MDPKLIDVACDAEDNFLLDELEDYANIKCPSCHHVNNRVEAHLGDLGRTKYYRCRGCGITWYS